MFVVRELPKLFPALPSSFRPSETVLFAQYM